MPSRDDRRAAGWRPRTSPNTLARAQHFQHQRERRDAGLPPQWVVGGDADDDGLMRPGADDDEDGGWAWSGAWGSDADWRPDADWRWNAGY